MSKLLNLSINLSKIDKSKIIEGKTGNKYLDIDVWINDDPDQYGNDASVSIRQSKDEREAKERKTYIGNGKKMFGWDDSQPASSPAPAPAPSASDELDDIPF